MICTTLEEQQGQQMTKKKSIAPYAAVYSCKIKKLTKSSKFHPDKHWLVLKVGHMDWTAQNQAP